MLITWLVEVVQAKSGRHGRHLLKRLHKRSGRARRRSGKRRVQRRRKSNSVEMEPNALETEVLCCGGACIHNEAVLFCTILSTDRGPSYLNFRIAIS
jgi:hypothetical protein